MANQLAVYLIAGVMASNLAFAETEGEPEWNRQTLSGNWGGIRSSWYGKGVSLEIVHKSDLLMNMSGGIKSGYAWMGNTEAGVRMNLEQGLGWDATTAYIHYHIQQGNKFNRDYVGSYVGVDNIEATVNTGQFNNIWMQKNFADDSLSVLAGLYAIDTEFYVTDTSAVFVQPPYGMANDMAQSGQNGPPIFPVGALAVRMKYAAAGKNIYLQGAVADGVPGDPNNPYGTHIQLNQGDGSLSVVEFGYTPRHDEIPAESTRQGDRDEGEYFNKTALGYWRYSSRFNDLDPANPTLHTSQGIYLLAERTLTVDKVHPSRGLSGFVRFGTASKDLYQADWTGSLGMRYRGWFTGRGDDIAGLAVTVSHASAKYRLLNNAENSQTAVEATYREQVYPWFALQPSLQYVAHPNMDKTIRNAWLFGVRFEVVF